MQPRRLLVLLALIPLFLVALPAHAGQRDDPPPLPGWTHPTRIQDDTPQQHGILLSSALFVRSSPVIAEIDGNTADGKEVAIGGSDGILYAFKSDGSVLWAINLMPTTCTVANGDFKMSSGPAVGAIYGDGVPYVVVGYGTIGGSDCDGGVVAIRGADGALAWRFSTKAWGSSHSYGGESTYGVLSSPALADTDGDGKMEIGFGSFDHRVYLLNGDGSVRWYYNAADTVWSSPAFVNVDSDSALEMVIGTDIAGKTPGGYVYAFDTQARASQSIDYGTGYIWRTFFEQAIYSSPVIADVLDSNPGSEVIIGASCFRPTGSTDKVGKWIKLLRLSDGALLDTLNAPACIQSSAAVGDLDDDGKLEVVATVNGAAKIGGDGKSRVIAWKPNASSDPWWSTIPTDPNGGNNDPYGGDIQSPVIADIDGNGSLEVLVANFWSVAILNGRTGAQLTCQGNATCGAQTSLFGWGTVKSTPAVGDINGDGVLDVVIGGSHAYYNDYKSAVMYSWTSLAGLIASPAGSQPAYSAPWPMFRGNAQHTGVLSVPSLRSSSSSVPTLLGVREGASTLSVTLTNPSDTPVTWRATSNQPWLTIIAPSGTTTSSAPSVLSFSVNPAGLAAGSYDGVVTVTSSVGTQTIAVPLIVANPVYHNYLPLSTR